MRSGYKELGLELVKILQDQPCKPQQPPIAEENKDDGAMDPFKILLEQDLEQQTNKMMDKFSQTLRRLPTSDTSSSNNHSWGATYFKVQANFDIPIFECQIDADIVDRWLKLLEVYFSIHDFSNQENITFALLKVAPHVEGWWETYYEQKDKRESSLFSFTPTWNFFRDAIKEQYYPVESYGDKNIKWTTLR